MEQALGHAVGSVLGVAIFAFILTGIAVIFGKIIGKPLDRVQVISTFLVSSLFCAAMVIYQHFHQ
jgi:hypothetical protein